MTLARVQDRKHHKHSLSYRLWETLRRFIHTIDTVDKFYTVTVNSALANSEQTLLVEIQG